MVSIAIYITSSYAIKFFLTLVKLDYNCLNSNLFHHCLHWNLRGRNYSWRDKFNINNYVFVDGRRSNVFYEDTFKAMFAQIVIIIILNTTKVLFHFPDVILMFYFILYTHGAITSQRH